MNGLVMYDWEPGLGMEPGHRTGCSGDVVSGVGLTVIPGWQTTWERWLEEHPETLVMDKRGGYHATLTPDTTSIPPMESWASPSASNVLGGPK